MPFVNLTPHPITLQYPDGSRVTVPSTGRATVNTKPVKHRNPIDGFPIGGPVEFGDVEGIPEPKPGVEYIVSAIVAAKAPRDDVYSPGTGPNDGAIREGGNIIAVTRLIASV